MSHALRTVLIGAVSAVITLFSIGMVGQLYAPGKNAPEQPQRPHFEAKISLRW